MNSTSTFSFATEPKGESYSDLLVFAMNHASTFQLVLRQDEPLGKFGRDLLHKLAPFLLNDAQVSEWQGTKLLDGGFANLLTYKVDPTAIQALNEHSQALYEWVHPKLPEDLIFLRSDQSLLLLTISHEKEADLVLLPSEVSDFRATCPDIGLHPR